MSASFSDSTIPPRVVCSPHAEKRSELPTCRFFYQANEAMVVADDQQRIVEMNRAFGDFIGHDPGQVLGLPLDEFIPGYAEVDSQTAGESGIPEQECDRFRTPGKCLHNSGEARSVMLSVSRLRDQDDSISHHVIVLADLSELSDSARHAGREVFFDALTGLPNLQLISQLINDAMEHAQRNGGELTICSLDIDHFKAINDRMGVQAGDFLISTFAQRISHLLGGDDVLARVGGDEFVLLLHEQADDASLERLLTAIRQPIRIGKQPVRISASLGVTHYPSDAASSEVLLRHATQAMYRAKQRGRNIFHRFDPDLDLALQVRQERRRRFAEGLAAGELRLHYQPQVNMASGEVVGLEALVRWQHPEEGLLAPGLFLPVIDGTSLEADLGEWVLQQALSQLEAWGELGIALPVSVNISPLHLLQDDFAERLALLLDEYPGMPPSMLKLEVLETAAMHDIGNAMTAIQSCHELGITVAIDDFGTGFSSLTYLRQLPVDLIKIDKSFVCDMLADSNDMAIVESIIYMANRFDRAMLAEGVETLEHARALVSLGCRLAQGFGIARPMPPDELPAWLVGWTQRQDWAELQHT